jgi:hypothetical protein
MPAQHKIDDHNKIITTIWSGEATDSELFDAVLKYQQDIKSRPEYRSYNEIADFSNTSVFHVSDIGITKIARLVASSDVNGVKTKLAIVVTVPPGHDLGWMYEVYRSLMTAQNIIVRVFHSHAEAFEWAIGNVS